MLRGGQALWLVVALVLAGLSGGIALAASEEEERERLAREDEQAREDAPRLDEDRTIQELVRRERARLAREEGRARGREGRERAARSRREHRGASRREARELASEEFPEFVDGPVWEPLQLREGERVSGFLDDNVARVDGGPGRRDLLAVSTVPMRAPGEDGEAAVVDLGLVERGGGFEPRVPIADVTIPGRLEDGVDVGDGELVVRPRIGDAVGERVGDRVFYRGEDSLDAVVSPAPTGVQVTVLVRSVEAAERVALDLDVPGDASLRVDEETGAVEVVRDGEAVVALSAPSAIDAADQKVDARYVLEGRRLWLEVDHRREGVTFPVAVDPLVPVIDKFRILDPNLGNRHTVGDNFAGWVFQANPQGVFASAISTQPTGQGLFVVGGYGNYYPNGAYGQWVYPSPTPDAYIERADFAYVDKATSGSCLVEGIFSGSRFAWDTGTSRVRTGGSEPSPVVDCTATLSGNYRAHCVGDHNRPGGASCVPGVAGDRTGTAGNAAVVGMYMIGAGVRNAAHSVTMYGATIWMHDDFDPAISRVSHSFVAAGQAPAAGLPGGWVDQATLYASATIQDRGLGPRVLGIYANGAGIANAVRPCTGSRASRCFFAWDTPGVAYATGGLPEGVVTMSARGFDVTGRQSPAVSWQVRVDHSDPTASLSGGLFAQDGVEEGEHELIVDVGDTFSGVASYTVTAAGRSVAGVTNSCPGAQCPRSQRPVYRFSTEGLARGTHEAVVTVRDGVGRTRTTRRSFTVADRTAPALEVSGGLRTFPVQTGRDARLVARDEGSGLKSIELLRRSLDDQGQPAGEFTRVAQLDACPSGQGCPTDARELRYVLAQTTPSGLYEFRALATDAAGLSSEEQWQTRVIALRSGDRQELGLEQWFDLEDTDAGGDSTTYVNGETGNLVWHQTPIVNPSRGLSSVVNLTYNAHERGGLLGLDLGAIPLVGLNPDDDEILGTDLLGASYREAGPGFSISVSGPTRVNDPLAGVTAATIRELVPIEQTAPEDLPTGLPEVFRITMTDADGTAHEFVYNEGTGEWEPPAGVDMRLRFVGGDDGLLDEAFRLLPKAVAELEDDRVWEMLRPDGVRHVFDRNGYLQETVDRNANVLDYVYEAVNPVTGESCDREDDLIGDLLDGLLDTTGLCMQRLEEVQSPTHEDTGPAERRVAFEYTEGLNLVPPLLGDLNLPLGLDLPLEAPILSTLLGQGPQIERITDADGRTYDFEYVEEGEKAGYLRAFTENSTGQPSDLETQPTRRTEFAYDEPKAEGQVGPVVGDLQQLTEVTPVENGTPRPSTTIEYEPRDPSLVLAPQPRRVAQIDKRDGSPKVYRYEGEGEGATFAVHEREQGDRYLTRESVLDGEGRPAMVTERSSRRVGEAFSAVRADGQSDEQAQTQRFLTWRDDQNKVEQMVEAPGTASGRMTDYTYDDKTGSILTRRVAAGGQTRAWGFDYFPDREDGYIADLQRMRLPGGREWTYEVEEATGNERFRTQSDGVRMETRYGTGGVVIAEQDAMGRWTDFPEGEYHHTGQPQTVRLPRGPGEPDRTWRYRYDDRGNPVQVADPRAPAPPGPAGAYPDTAAFVTSLDYDGFDRLLSERMPRCTAEDCEAPNGDGDPGDGAAWMTQTRTFDRDGVAVSITDPTGATTRVEHDDMDRPRVVRAPSANGIEETRFVHDDAQRLIGELRPKASATGAQVDGLRGSQAAACAGEGLSAQAHATRWCLDHLGRPLAEVRTSTQDGDVDALISSFAYDGRGNRTRVVDPNRNTTGQGSARQPVGVDAAIAAAASGPARSQTTYDLLDRPLVESEDALEGGVPDRRREYVYSAADDLERVVDRDAQGGDRTMSMTYDPMGRMTSRSDALGRKTCWERQADGLVTAITTPRGTSDLPMLCTGAPGGSGYEHFTTRMEYDFAGDLTSRSVPYAPQQYGPGREDVEDWKVTYDRNAVGDPVGVTDARGNEIRNTFYDGGQLRSTDRPGWWELEWPSDEANPEAGNQYTATDSADVEVAVDGPQLTERTSRTAGALEGDQEPEKPQGLGATDLGAIKDAELPGWLPKAGQTRVRYDEMMRLTEVQDAQQRVNRIGYDEAGRVERKSWPLQGGLRIAHSYQYDTNGNLGEATEDWKPDEQVETSFAYDGYDRRVSETAPGSNPGAYSGDPVAELTRFEYDANDNVTGRRTARSTAFGYGYDSLDQLRSESNPVDQVWEYAYNPFEQPTREVSPGARAPGVDAELFTSRHEYDAAGQHTAAVQMVDTTDAAGDPSVSALRTEMGYDDDGNRVRVEAPGSPDRTLTLTDHDARGLPWRTTTRAADRAATPDERDGSRTSITEYDANGALRRTVTPAGIDPDTRLPRNADAGGEDDLPNLREASRDATVRITDPDDLLLLERMPWRERADPQGRVVRDASGEPVDDGRYEREWERNAVGWVDAIQQPRELGDATVFRTTYEHNDAGWITSISDIKRTGVDDGSQQPPLVDYAWDEQGHQTGWVSKNASDDRGREIGWEYWPSGLLKRRSATKPLEGAQPDATRTYDYLYNANRSLARVVDRDAARDPAPGSEEDGPEERVTVFGRDDAERESYVQEDWSRGKDVNLGYDAFTGDQTLRQTRGQYDRDSDTYTGQDAKTTTFDFDSLGRETKMTVDPSDDKPDRVTRTRWSDGGAMIGREKPNETVERWSWNVLGEKVQKVRDPVSGATDTQPYDYDANGNRTTDERGRHWFNARDQLTRWKRPTDSGRSDRRGWMTSYELNGTGAITRKVEDDDDDEANNGAPPSFDMAASPGTAGPEVDTFYEYDGDRLERSVTADRSEPTGLSVVKARSTYRYDDAQNVQRIYTQQRGWVAGVSSDPEPQPVNQTPLEPQECAADDTTASTSTVRYCYDEFNRQILATGTGEGEPSVISYDGLDRRDRKTTDDGALGGEEVRDYSYIGASELLAHESVSDDGILDEDKTRTYDYDSQGDRQGFDKHDGTYRAYDKDANGSVTGLEQAQGQINEGTALGGDETYDYDPYGELDRDPPAGSSDLDAGLSQDAQDNPFRFQGFYYDSGVKTYDMHARHYRPDIQRFLSRDLYASATGDQALQADPLTQNRYAFAGANPVTNIEFDGHIGWEVAHVAETQGTEASDRYYKKHYSRMASTRYGKRPTGPGGQGVRYQRNYVSRGAPNPTAAPQPVQKPSKLTQDLAWLNEKSGLKAKLNTECIRPQGCSAKPILEIADGDPLKLLDIASNAGGPGTSAAKTGFLAVLGVVGKEVAELGARRGATTATKAGPSLAGKSYGKLGTVVEKPDLRITGFRGSRDPRHAMNQIINRGVSPSALRDTVGQPSAVLKQSGGNYLFLSQRAGVVLRADGQVVTAYTGKQFKPHIQQVLRDAGGG